MRPQRRKMRQGLRREASCGDYRGCGGDRTALRMEENKVVLRWKEKEHTEPGSTRPVFLLREISYLGLQILPYFPSLNPHLNPKNCIVKIDSCPSSFSRGDNAIILSFSTLHLPHPHTHTQVYIF